MSYPKPLTDKELKLLSKLLTDVQIRRVIRALTLLRRHQAWLRAQDQEEDRMAAEACLADGAEWGDA